MSEDMNTRQGRRKAKQQQKNNRKNKGGFFRKLVISLLILMVISVVAGGITLFAMIQQAPELDPDRLTLAQSAQIYDQNDEQFVQLQASENRVKVNIQDVPQLVEDAIIATEDVRFRDHFGIDIRRLFGAVAANISNGFGAEGASTITQQVVKNLFLTSDKTISRKVQEQYLAIKLEQQYSKDQILEMYLNAIYFSKGAYGIVQAADTYFGKTLDELEIEDAALLAGIPQRPNYYNPFVNPDAAEQRRNTVIALMERHEKISSEEAEAARAVPVVDQLNEQEQETYPYEAFLDHVLAEVDEMDGISTNDLYTAGLKVYTTLDRDAQSHVESVLQTDQYINGYPNSESFQAGITLIDTKTGEIKAIGGGRNKNNVQRGFNFATDIKKQPGSTIKPVLDYGPAIDELQWSTAHILVDEPHTYSNGDPLRNYSRSYRGRVTLREALVNSDNIPAIKALQEVGLDSAQQFAERLGIPFENRIEEAYGLGGFTTGISTLDLAGAYSAFGNEGIYNKPHTIRKIVFPDGREIRTTPDPVVAMNDYTAYMISDMLKSVVNYGTGRHASIPGLPLAGKTGTTNFTPEDISRYNIPSGGVPDVWFAGYTTNYTAAVWTGYDKKGENHYLSGNERRLAQQIFKAVMSEVSKAKETADFKQPNSVVRVGVERSTGLLPSDSTPSDQVIYELFVEGTEPRRVSNVYQKMTAPQDFAAGYNEDTNQIIMSWGYPEDERSGVSFRLDQRIGDGEYTNLTSSRDMQYIVLNPEPGQTYHFRLTAINDSNQNRQSDPVQTSVTVPGVDVIEEDDDLDEDIDEDIDLPEDLLPREDDEDQDENDQDQGQSQGNDNGERENNSNRGNNGNGNNQNEDEPDDVEDEEEARDLLDITG
ncbi:PBP1A family penicillin-binding protein [Desertibacillus haloalkaliphilus]|uniref:PBP1A family penicillin-binding protein n=1 Tax=Desertibacillus haloalkaliphilus TaxID=1328930 RepID=UPI001C276766|nr:PBP1A family penicillin-binding protein [Desertibacillus haloalkaliphilus]MBU8907292.1 PBP1A family penicillin-binding protein [Desertibacillus haloalkaliphilus]